MKITISGMNGFVGRAIRDYFTAKGGCVIGMKVRSETTVEEIVSEIDGRDVLINLSGANILSRWSESYKQTLYHSRIDTTQKLVEAIGKCANPPKVLLSASAVGIYDSEGSHTESSGGFSGDFLGTLCEAWEAEARKASEYGVRVCTMRFGVIFGKDGGAITKMLLPFKLGLGGNLGDGKQKVSWIHIDDLVGAVEHLITHETLEGVFNFTAPEVVTNAEQTRHLAHALHRPAFMTVPAFAVKLLFGEGAGVVLDSKEVYPERLMQSGYSFRYPSQQKAFEQIVSL